MLTTLGITPAVCTEMRCRRTCSIEKLMLGYTIRHHLSRGHLCFQYDGLELLPTQTPDDLDMEDGAVIYALRVIVIAPPGAIWVG